MYVGAVSSQVVAAWLLHKSIRNNSLRKAHAMQKWKIFDSNSGESGGFYCPMCVCHQVWKDFLFTQRAKVRLPTR
jgi:hypothetical protein